MITKIFKASKLHPLKIHPIQELCEDDPDLRNEFWDEMMRKIYQHELLLFATLLFMRIWIVRIADTGLANPNWKRELHTPENINVWAGIRGNRKILPIFFESNLTYSDFLSIELISLLTNFFPIHIYHIFRYGFNRTSPPYIFSYGVFPTKPANIQDLKDRITAKMRTITPHMFKNVRVILHNRLSCCQEIEETHFEELVCQSIFYLKHKKLNFFQAQLNATLLY